MISSTLAPLGRHHEAGQQVFDSGAFRLISPPNFVAGAEALPSIVVVALGEPVHRLSAGLYTQRSEHKHQANCDQI